MSSKKTEPFKRVRASQMLMPYQRIDAAFDLIEKQADRIAVLEDAVERMNEEVIKEIIKLLEVLGNRVAELQLSKQTIQVPRKALN
jgi:hypothetical protein